MQRARVKKILFSTLAAIRPELAAGAWGSFDSAKDTIYLDAKLPASAIPGRGAVLSHERGHELAYKSGIEPLMSPEQLEAFCDFHALAFAPKRSLTGVEILARQVLFSGAKDRRGKLKKIILLCRIKQKRLALKRLG